MRPGIINFKSKAAPKRGTAVSVKVAKSFLRQLNIEDVLYYKHRISFFVALYRGSRGLLLHARHHPLLIV